MVNGDNANYMHTSYAPSEKDPVVLEARLAEEITANRIIFDGSHNSENAFLPKAFKVYVSSDGTSWELACDIAESKLSSDKWQVTAMFDDMYTFSYYRIVITATHNQYIALRQIIFQKYVVELENGNQLTPDSENLNYFGDWSVQSTYSTFGHVYVGNDGAKLTFKFDGTRLGILSAEGLGTGFTVEIDGEVVNSIDLIELSTIGASYVSELLSEGEHTVTITCVGTANIDSIVVW
jgi:hypothetical protein